MSYVSFYRKYRSQTFQDVMGQEHITRTLQNAIRQGKIAHAYLFSGTRGTGKTTTARLLAKALNCDSGPTPEPCNQCVPCRSITDGTAVDVVELDAASHRGIDDVKEIRNNVQFPPMALRYKVFIIDEAHQLSSDAKDAFLKTLEEPPAHAVFILATTEPHKIPITIRSRCQQFDFRRGSVADIHARLKFVAESEGIEADDEALDLIAMNAEGSWRDALSLLEQVLAYTDGRLTPPDVYAMLGTVTQDLLFRLGDLVASGDEAGAFEAAREAAESGKDLRQLLRSLADHFRNVLFAAATSGRETRSFSGEFLARLREQAAKFKKPRLLRIIEVFSQAEQGARSSDQQKLLLELALLKTISVAQAEATQPKPSRPTTPAAKSPIPAKPSTQEHVPEAKPKPKPAAAESTEKPPVSGEQELPKFDTIRQKWNLVLQHVRSISLPAYALLVEATPIGVKDGSIVLQFKHLGQANLIRDEAQKRKEPTKKKVLQMAIEQVFGVPNVGIMCELGKQEHESGARRADDAELPNPFEAAGDETLRDVLDIFNGKIVDD